MYIVYMYIPGTVHSLMYLYLLQQMRPNQNLKVLPIVET